MFDYLFAEPSFWHGCGRVLDLGGTFDDYNESADPTEADGVAIATDWISVGRDIQVAMDVEGAD